MFIMTFYRKTEFIGANGETFNDFGLSVASAQV